jgi:FkbM family methyltransferase
MLYLAPLHDEKIQSIGGAMLKKTIEKLMPRLLWRHRAKSWGYANSDPELALLSEIVDRRKTSVDIGGADGIYTAMLIPVSERVIAFEPVPHIAQALRDKFAGTSIVSVEQIALSDRAGKETMRVPTDRFWRSTIETGNNLRYSNAIDNISVTTKTLDEYAFPDIGFVKIDVEGHELAVLKGAIETLRRERPTFIVEIEEQHCAGAVRGAFDYFEREGYRGVFLENGTRKPISAFDPTVHQNLDHLDKNGAKRGLYINNFIFVPEGHPFRIP